MSIIPTTLHHIRVFESTSAYVDAPGTGGRRRVETSSTLSIDEQCVQWVAATRNQIVGAGQLAMRVYTKTPLKPGEDPITFEHRSLPVIYIPAVEHNHVRPANAASQSVAEVRQEPKPASAPAPVAAGRNSLAPRRGTLRVPSIS